ncbi:GNAT family N-acetyltransferase [Hymenobacter lutimineralis]|uniref:GNAT family N-acetyltransferase n=1 Tax=Hymenobacter lutimineralis TaxID=2606448 RepID=A0A5D6UW11_9BACT|nr:GNAT family N-acetyltransferase [Hymenobacter lutimineralis]TYZ07078.1 GNAT family N-acetyltransferase [Hymenobacter lutimineralis]
MPRLLRYRELDLTAWDACVASAREGLPYACSWWLHATAGRWDALVEIEAHTGRYLAVWPLPVKWRPWGQEVYQPLFTQQLGAYSLAEEAGQLSSLSMLAMDRLTPRYTRFYAQLNDANKYPTQLLLGHVGKPSVLVEHRQTYHLPLEAPYDVLRATYAADYRRRLRQHENASAPLAIADTADAEALLQLFQQTKGPEAGLKPRHYRTLRRLIIALRQRNLLEVYEARQPGTGALLAGALFVRYRQRLIYLFAAASAEGKKAAAPLVLLDAAIRRHAGTPGLILDFEGSMIPSIARFFANFGATPVCYAALSFTQRPWYLQWMR